MTTATAAPRTVRFGEHTLTVGGPDLGELRDANALLDDPAALRARMAEDGYLLIRGLHDRDKVLAARREMADRLMAQGALDKASDAMDLVPNKDWHGGFYGGINELTTCPAFQEFTGTGRVMDFFARFLGGPVRTYDFRWLRVVGAGGATGAHIDRVYMGRGTDELYTCWTPIGDTAYDQGPLAICVGSHRLPGYRKVHETYGEMDVDRDFVQGWFSDDPLEVTRAYGGRWATTEFHAGDALLFGMRTMHASLVNTSQRLRLSSDTRYQLAAEAVDERWIGEKPIGHYAWHTPGKGVAMADARKRWGV